ncbi:MAG TPA: hypothetical protein PLP33_29510 [Leptospiraceae bacterium]|nr:hypothetical protein [Leptospiraceae bacterium]
MLNQYPQILKAMQAMAGMCDGASSRDNVGFNGRDVHFGHAMAEKNSLTENMAKACVKLLRTYKNTQLPKYGISYEDLQSELENPQTIQAEEIFQLEGIILTQTEKAWQVQFSGGKVCWLPKSRVALDCDGVFHVPAWLVKSNGLHASN